MDHEQQLTVGLQDTAKTLTVGDKQEKGSCNDGWRHHLFKLTRQDGSRHSSALFGEFKQQDRKVTTDVGSISTQSTSGT